MNTARAAGLEIIAHAELEIIAQAQSVHRVELPKFFRQHVRLRAIRIIGVRFHDVPEVFILLNAGGAFVEIAESLKGGFHAQFRQAAPHGGAVAQQRFHFVGGADDLAEVVRDGNHVGNRADVSSFGIIRAAIARARNHTQEPEVTRRPIHHVGGINRKAS